MIFFCVVRRVLRQGGVFSPIIPRNTLIPHKAAKMYTTVRANQPSILIEVFQGESEMAKRNEKLGTFELDDIPAAPRGQPQIEVGPPPATEPSVGS